MAMLRVLMAARAAPADLQAAAARVLLSVHKALAAMAATAAMATMLPQIPMRSQAHPAVTVEMVEMVESEVPPETVETVEAAVTAWLEMPLILTAAQAAMAGLVAAEVPSPAMAVMVARVVMAAMV